MASKNLEKKILRKQKRCQQIISSEMNITFTDIPTEILVICNAGLSTFLKIENLIAEVEKPLKQILMLPGKSFCFLIFYKILDSQIVYDKMHGKSELGQNSGILYLSFAEELPKIKDPWTEELPPGLIIVENFVTDSEEDEILRSLGDWDDNADDSDTDRQLKHRKVKHFGYEFIYGSNNVDRNHPLPRKIPDSCQILWNRLKQQQPELNWHSPDQMTANMYVPGQGIPPHVDTHSAFEDPILSLSLSDDTVMEFRSPKDGRHSYIYLKKRSLLIMSGEVRLGWTHGITPRKSDIIKTADGLTVRPRNLRISLTFRKLKENPSCTCDHRNLCDIPKNSIKSPAELEFENVHQVYNQIGYHFSETRHSPWPKVECFINDFATGSVLCDIGCGNGKYLNTNENIIKMGCDRSESLLNVCLERNFNVFLSDCLCLPIRSHSVDGCISIAVIHHLASYDRRLKAIQEMSRILVAGGKGLIYVWAKNQKADNKKSSYLRQNKNNSRENNTPADAVEVKSPSTDLPVHTNRTEFKHQDILVPWKLKSQNQIEEKEVFLRYYHVFDEFELENMCSEINEIKIVQSYYDQGNWCVIFEKL